MQQNLLNSLCKDFIPRKVIDTDLLLADIFSLILSVLRKYLKAYKPFAQSTVVTNRKNSDTTQMQRVSTSNKLSVQRKYCYSVPIPKPAPFIYMAQCRILRNPRSRTKFFTAECGLPKLSKKGLCALLNHSLRVAWAWIYDLSDKTEQ
ncbi:hypothetical protein LOAG_02424 [Loa loa]|uniref:Uncharacterized protein n=1 Tax=Loa loa TaxID=7209 RepID=A0A1S0U7I0_LOALO|nr:hypothetical protein LOAG_02424 [Loa loa]EFO26061.2 hypothetical protein LOAG_02424 [Loa loa]